MAAVSLFWDTNMATVMSCENTLYVDRNEQAFFKQVTSFVVRYDDIYHSVPINSQYLMMWVVDRPV